MLIGNVGKHPELRYTPSGIPVINFRLATSEAKRGKDGSIREKTDWHTVVAWRGLAEVINKIVKKGSKVYVEGRIQTRNFQDKNGRRRHVVEVLAHHLLILDNRKNRNEQKDQDESAQNHAESTDNNDSEILDSYDNFDGGDTDYTDDDYDDNNKDSNKSDGNDILF